MFLDKVFLCIIYKSRCVSVLVQNCLWTATAFQLGLCLQEMCMKDPRVVAKLAIHAEGPFWVQCWIYWSYCKKTWCLNLTHQILSVFLNIMNTHNRSSLCVHQTAKTLSDHTLHHLLPGMEVRLKGMILASQFAFSVYQQWRLNFSFPPHNF